jgi:hypothetical protein
MSVTGWVILRVVNIPIYILIGRVFFKDWGEFGEAIVFWFKPDLFSALSGEYWDDWWAEMKLGIFIAASAYCVWTDGRHLVEPYLLPMFQ